MTTPMTRSVTRRELNTLLATGFIAGLLARMPAASAAETITVYKSPTCGCCGRWVEHLRANGFTVAVEEQDDLEPIKAELGVPDGLAACHTAVIGGYVVEGHVPAADIRRLLETRPAATGLAVPGMPAGSPGMDQGSRKEPYRVLLFTGEETSVFASH